MFGVRDAGFVIAAVCVLGLIVSVWWMNVRLDAAEAARDTARATVAGYEAKEKAQAKLTIEQENTNATLSQRLQDNPDWADQPVPDDLADLLRKH